MYDITIWPFNHLTFQRYFMKKILIAGGTGLLGTRLSFLLQEKGYQVLHLSRQQNLDATFPAYKWDLKEKYIDPSAMNQADVIINLAGAGVADARWTDARKKLIIDSRVDSASLLKSYISSGKTPAKTYLSASAIGYYGDRGNQLLKETDPPGDEGFLPKSVVAWENAINEVAGTGIRTVAFRIGIVLSTKGGALEKMLIPFNFFNGTYFGDGSMYYSWIHIDDMARMFIMGLHLIPPPIKKSFLRAKKRLANPPLSCPPRLSPFVRPWAKWRI